MSRKFLSVLEAPGYPGVAQDVLAQSYHHHNDNLVYNSSFEIPDPADVTKPHGWKCYSVAGPITWGLQTTAANLRSGFRSAYMTIGDGTGSLRISSEGAKFPVATGEQLWASVWYQTSSSFTGNAVLCSVLWWDAVGAFISSNGFGNYSASTTGARAAALVTPPAGAVNASVQVQFHGPNISGGSPTYPLTIYIDDAILVRADGPTSYATARTLGTGSTQAAAGDHGHSQLVAPLLVVNNGAISVVPVAVKGVSGQTGDLQQWQDSTGAVRARISNLGSLAVTNGTSDTASIDGSVGYFRGAGITKADNTGGYVTLDGAGAAGHGVVVRGRTTNQTTLVVRPVAAQSADLQQWVNDTAGSVLAKVTKDGIADVAGLLIGGQALLGQAATQAAPGNHPHNFDDNLVMNGGFEVASPTDATKPFAWIGTVGAGSPTWGLNTTAANLLSGTKSAYITITAGTDHLKITSDSAKFPCTTGEILWAQLRVKTSAVYTGNGVRSYIDWEDASGAYLSSTLIGQIPGDTNWGQMQALVTPPANATQGSFMVQHYGPNITGSPTYPLTLYIDACTVTRAITDQRVAAANKDGAVGTASMRTIGTGALQAAAGNHGHLGLNFDMPQGETLQIQQEFDVATSFGSPSNGMGTGWTSVGSIGSAYRETSVGQFDNGSAQATTAIIGYTYALTTSQDFAAYLKIPRYGPAAAGLCYGVLVSMSTKYYAFVYDDADQTIKVKYFSNSTTFSSDKYTSAALTISRPDMFKVTRSSSVWSVWIGIEGLWVKVVNAQTMSDLAFSPGAIGFGFTYQAGTALVASAHRIGCDYMRVM